jgi:hypothetical protein
MSTAPEVGKVEAHRHLGRAELQHDRFAAPDADLVRHERELLRHDRDHPLGREGARGEQRRRREGGRAEAASTSRRVVVIEGRLIAQALATPRSVMRTSGVFACAATLAKAEAAIRLGGPSHGTGVRFGCEPGAGKGKISDFAEWCAMCPVMR